MDTVEKNITFNDASREVCLEINVGKLSIFAV
jgi:hypothetical protein